MMVLTRECREDTTYESDPKEHKNSVYSQVMFSVSKEDILTQSYRSFKKNSVLLKYVVFRMPCCSIYGLMPLSGQIREEDIRPKLSQYGLEWA